MEEKTIVLVAHDSKKKDLLEWAKFNKGTLEKFILYATKTTGEEMIKNVDLKVHLLQSGPLGGDSQIATMIVEGKVNMLIFFWDPLTPQPHDVDVKALLRIAVLYNIPVACNRTTADYIISSPLLN
ncbi:MAG: methylglyoxal synthase [bacterium]